MDWNLKTILILLAVLFAGYAIGLLEMHLRRARKIHELQAALQAAPPASAATAPLTPGAPAEAGVPVIGAGLLRLSANTAGSPLLELDGIPFHSPAELTPTQRRRLVTLLTELRPWVEGRPAAPLTRKVPAPEVPASSPGSIVGQINDILQARLVGTPLAEKRIRLFETGSGSALVYIGEQFYENVEVVPDAEVKAAIRAAIETWEKGVK